ncbi:predicted protein [Plenodomus lingam JN3]|uniref:Predicted protein n=1 Tax=Leptosphaeria maculans (strain JN3 / isolate v23.1.3 / race Av1-4-5-6-7-8) TaxID=985895 RepID=E4ZNY3_LEPMJ|nr:predicted protein [Plenodomus lingam JN3]CBX93352.1 predicted protein [Plenodomus lingam JN3]
MRLTIPVCLLFMATLPKYGPLLPDERCFPISLSAK